jgi:hypothetical protein
MMRLAPETFWNMTLTEWRATLAGFAQARGLRTVSPQQAMHRDDFLRLMQLYPDTRP